MEPSILPRPEPSIPVLVRVDAFALELAWTDADGTRYRVAPSAALHALSRPALPLYERLGAGATVTLRASGVASGAFSVALAVEGTSLQTPVAVPVGTEGGFSLELTVPVKALLPHAGRNVRVQLALGPGERKLLLLRADLVAVAGSAPAVVLLDVREATDSLLVNAPERKLFDLQNPEEGFWLGTGRWRLRVLVDWEAPSGATDTDPGWTLDLRPERVAHNLQRAGDATDIVYEEPSRRAGGKRTYTELFLDTSHPELASIVPPEGVDLPLRLELTHGLGREGAPLALTWARDLPLRLRDPRPLLPGFRRLSGVGIDFGTTATVAAFSHRGYRSLMRLGSPPEGMNPAENPTVLLVEDHERLWTEMARTSATQRFPHLLRVVQASHAAREKMSEHPASVVGEIKSMPERVVVLDQSPQLRDRERKADFLLDEARVRALVRTYAYLLGRAINRPGQEVFLRYWLTYPAEFDERARALLMEELRAGIVLSVPEGIAAEEVVVQMQATEPEAYAAEVCPELAGHPAFASLVERYGELRFAVFDFGGGTLDIACGRYRPATPEEEARAGCSSVIETLQVAGDDHLGGDYLTHELVWLTHQHEAHLPELEAREVPMQRPVTIPENKLARKPQLYKRSLAARKNRVRFQDLLGLEAVKFRRENEVLRVESLPAWRLDDTEVALETLKNDLPGLQKKLATHLEERVRDGARLLASMLASTPWEPAAPGAGTTPATRPASSWRELGVVILLAGNSARSEYVERALAQALDAPDLKVWHPTDTFAPQGVVLYETPTRMDRGAEILGVTPKTAVALGALKIANRDVHLVRAAQGFSYFVGDLKGFPPRFTPLLALGAVPADPNTFGPHYVDFGAWDSQKPLRVSKEYEARMSANDPRIVSVRPELPPDTVGRLYACAVSPTAVGVHFVLPDETVVRTTLNLQAFFT
jgi:hypothetical protein